MNTVKKISMMFALIAVISVTVFGQLNVTLGGHVKEATTNAPLVGVKVFIYDTTNSIAGWVYTDSNGDFSRSFRRNNDYLIFLDSSQCSYRFPSSYNGTATGSFSGFDFDATCP